MLSTARGVELMCSDLLHRAPPPCLARPLPLIVAARVHDSVGENTQMLLGSLAALVPRLALQMGGPALDVGCAGWSCFETKGWKD